jgi:hypothetical protein
MPIVHLAITTAARASPPCQRSHCRRRTQLFISRLLPVRCRNRIWNCQNALDGQTPLDIWRRLLFASLIGNKACACA